MNFKTKILKVFGWLLVIIIVVVIALGAWLYIGSLTPTKIKAFSYLPFPAASVNGRFIPIDQFVLRYNISKNLGLLPNEQQILDQLINEKKIAVLAGNKGAGVSNKQVDSDYGQRSKQANLEGKKDFNQLLKGYGISAQQYKSEVIAPALELVNLQTWFYSQSDLNQTAYNQADNLVQKIQKDDNMSLLASQYSQQDSDRSTGGDLGYINPTELLPEVQESVDSMKTGDIKIVPSRYGIQILKLEDKEGNTVHLREIFLKGSDFQTWYNNETKNYSVHQFLKN